MPNLNGSELINLEKAGVFEGVWTKRLGWAVFVHYAHTTQHVSGKKPMVKHLVQDGDGFLPSNNIRNETPASIALETMLHYKQTCCSEARNWLIEYYMRTFVRNAARRIASGLPKCVDPDDLEQVGFFGLIECIDKFDPSRNFKFVTFARQRVEGSMRDELRRIDPASRLARTRTKMIARGIEQFKSEHGRSPTDDELRKILQLDEKEFAAVMRDIHVPNTLQFHPVDEDDGDGLMAMSIEHKSSGCGVVDQIDLHEWLCTQLGTYDKLIVALTYTEGLTMLEIGHTLGYSESRVSQRLKHIHAVLKSKISDDPEDWWLRAG